MELLEPKVSIKIKLSVLWTSLMFCFVYGDYFELYVPDKVDSLLSGVNILDSPLKLFLASLVLCIPALMVSLTILLKASIGRVLNIVFGSLFAIMQLLIAFGSLVPWYAFYAFLGFVESILALLIIYLAIKWPKGELTDIDSGTQ